MLQSCLNVHIGLAHEAKRLHCLTHPLQSPGCRCIFREAVLEFWVGGQRKPRCRSLESQDESVNMPARMSFAGTLVSVFSMVLKIQYLLKR
jgi:hypothetical protein